MENSLYVYTHTNIHTHTHTHTCASTHIFHESIKFVIATEGCGISHKDTEHTDKCSNNKTKTTQKPQTNTFFKIL